MARIADPVKFENVKKITMELIVKKGFHGVTVADIAKEADVSVGYIYMYYKDKVAIVRSIYESKLKEFHDHIYSLIEQFFNVEEIIKRIISHIFQQAKENPVIIKFIFIMTHDYTFAFPASRLKSVKDICKKILEKGIKTGEIGPDKSSEDVFITLFSIPLKLLESRMKKIFNTKVIDESDEERISELCLNALK